MKRLDIPIALAWIAALALAMWLGVVRYQECRDHGFSVLYCATR